MKVRLETMGKLHCGIFLIAIALSISAFIAVSANYKNMLIYDHGDTFTCNLDKADSN